MCAATEEAPPTTEEAPPATEEAPPEAEFGIDAEGKIHGYYKDFWGHPTEFLAHIHSQLPGPYIFFVGDSTLDNKFWMKPEGDVAPAVNGFDKVLEPPEMKMDVAYWINKIAEEKGIQLRCLCTAVEASTIEERKGDRPGRFFYASDEFVHDNLTPDDVVVFSAFGNDLVLKTTWKTLLLRTWITWFSWRSNIRSGRAWGMQYFVDMIKVHSRNSLLAVCDKHKPKYVFSTMCYHPCLTKQGAGWCDWPLRLLCYDLFPGRLQTLTTSVYRLGCKQLDIPGTTVLPLPMFSKLTGENPDHYMERAEPSASGGKIIAELIMDGISKGKDFDPELPEPLPDSIVLRGTIFIGLLSAALVGWRIARKL